MALLAKHIVQRVVGTLQDTTSIRWPVDELLRYLNDAQREVVLYRPDAMVKNAPITCVQGTRQSIPSGATKLIEIVRNTNGNRKAIRLTNREILDAQTPGWHAISPVTEAVHFMFDHRDPRTFYLYPPVQAGVQVDSVFSAPPVDVPSVGEGKSLDDIPTSSSYELSLPDIYGNVVQDYMLYRAYMKDSEYAGNVNRAQAHYAAFANALGLEIKATVAVQPNSAGNPNTARPQQ